MLKVICAGLPRTGTGSIAEALRILGYNTLSAAPERLPLFPEPGFDFRVYDDVDAVADLPAAMYWLQLANAYPHAKLILTTRDEDPWYESMKRMVDAIHASGDMRRIAYADQLHSLVFGSPESHPYWYKRRFAEHEESIYLHGRCGRAGLKSCFVSLCDYARGRSHQRDWYQLCAFLDKPIPDVPFPWVNKTETA